MADLPDSPPPSRRSAARSTRRTRFVLPADHHDERVGERIEAFLEGPTTRARRTGRRARSETLRAVRRPIPMDTRADWDLALRHEDARVARYGRPASVLVVRVRMPVSGAEDRYAARVGSALREHARETDRVTRASADRFHVLLPETVEAEAAALAERVRDACTAFLPGQPGTDLEIVAAAVSPVRGGSLVDALREAQRRVAEETEETGA